MPVPPGVKRGEMDKFFFSKLFNFYVFYIYIIFFCIPEYLTLMYLLCTDVGPVRPKDFLRTRRRPRPEAGPTGVVEPTTTVGGVQLKRLREY
jgi:hypothetical protein